MKSAKTIATGIISTEKGVKVHPITANWNAKFYHKQRYK